MKRHAIVERYCLTPSSLRKTWHLAFRGEDVEFRSGDSIGVYPRNDRKQVECLLSYFRLSPSSAIIDPKTKAIVPAESWFSSYVEINRVSPHMIRYVAACAHDAHEKENIRFLQREEVDRFDLPSFLMTYVSKGVSFKDIQYGFLPLLPRLYSIASAPSSRQIELTVSQVVYEQKVGVCSNYLVDRAPLNEKEIVFFLHRPKSFFFPDQTPVIMLGAGTGIAPFRSFVQEMEMQGVRTPCWLFFGEQYRHANFLYEPFWMRQAAAGKMKLSLAFSRDQEDKMYVQHRMWEERKELWRWIEEGASILLCGNAKRLARGVDQMLLLIAESEGAMSKEEANNWAAMLKEEKRYLRDVY